MVNVQMELAVPEAGLCFFLRRCYGAFSSFDSETFGQTLSVGSATKPVFLSFDPHPIALGFLQSSSVTFVP